MPHRDRFTESEPEPEVNEAKTTQVGAHAIAGD
jgi:hypothetical protein